MSPWITLFIGLVIGWIVGVLIARQNYETCRKQIERMKQELMAQDVQLETARQEIADLETKIKETSPR
ncbi:MAG TPA: hypothetical protein EYP25_04405 [Anaerolineae bacterium]|nr:hypothetical protein [Anaerolineae bacterium]